MPKKTIPISTRLSAEDAEFIAQWEGEGAATPSEKLRGIIAEARRHKLGAEDYSGSLRLVTGWLAPTLHGIRTSEHATGVHSELVTRVAEWLPEALAYLIASDARKTPLDLESLAEIERGLATRVVNLMQSVLQMAVTRTGPCYDPEVIRERIQPVLDLAKVVSRN